MKGSTKSSGTILNSAFRAGPKGEVQDVLRYPAAPAIFRSRFSGLREQPSLLVLPVNEANREPLSSGHLDFQ